jgi:hypothetical protein
MHSVLNLTGHSGHTQGLIPAFHQELHSVLHPERPLVLSSKRRLMLHSTAASGLHPETNTVLPFWPDLRLHSEMYSTLNLTVRSGKDWGTIPAFH